MFSLVNLENKPLLMKCQESSTAIHSQNDWGPIFGSYSDDGCDLAIYTDSNAQAESYSHLGSTNKHPEYVKGTEKAKNFLAGSYNFMISEIEVLNIQSNVDIAYIIISVYYLFSLLC